MKKYHVEITYSSTATYDVVAKNEADAKQMALDERVMSKLTIANTTMKSM